MNEADLTLEIASVQTALNQAVIAKECIPDPLNSSFKVDETRFCGIGMYIPEAYNPYVTSKTSWNTYYESSIAWYRAAGWDTLN